MESSLNLGQIPVICFFGKFMESLWKVYGIGPEFCKLLGKFLESGPNSSNLPESIWKVFGFGQEFFKLS